MKATTNITDGAQLLPTYKSTSRAEIERRVNWARTYAPEGVTHLEVQTVLAKGSDDRGQGPARFHVVVMRGTTGSSVADFLTLSELFVFLRGLEAAWEMAD